jgi:hypothetical protein
MADAGLKCVYPNSGAFGFAGGGTGRVVGWVSGADSTIKPGLAADLSVVPRDRLAQKLVDRWQRDLPGPAWLVPKSHWSFELQHGNGEWLAPLLLDAGVDPAELVNRTTAAAIEFLPDEAQRLVPLAHELLQRLTQSDFAVLFPPRPVLVTLHRG